jgi:hypothetical protein
MGSRETHTTIYNLGEGTGTAAITSKLTKKSEAFLQSLLAKNAVSAVWKTGHLRCVCR